MEIDAAKEWTAEEVEGFAKALGGLLVGTEVHKVWLVDGYRAEGGYGLLRGAEGEFVVE